MPCDKGQVVGAMVMVMVPSVRFLHEFIQPYVGYFHGSLAHMLIKVPIPECTATVIKAKGRSIYKVKDKNGTSKSVTKNVAHLLTRRKYSKCIKVVSRMGRPGSNFLISSAC